MIEYNTNIKIKNGAKMRVKFITLGCKTNQYETNAMEEKFAQSGYEIVDKNEISDILVINTCSVTNIAERKSRQMLRKAKEQNTKAITVACGCYAQVAKEDIEKMPEVDVIIGINEKINIVEIVEEYIKNKTAKNKVEEISDVMHQSEFEEFGTTTYKDQNRAVIKIQDGCDRFCTYCIIPYARGKVRSRKPENILKEIKEIAQKGIKEVVITGIHIASYGKDFIEEDVLKYRKEYNYSEKYEKFNPTKDLSSGGFRLIELLEQINKIDEIERIRIGSLEPILITKEFVSRLSKINKICNHFHLSLQSGCNETLKRMNRRYTVEEFENSVKMLRNAYKNVALTTDIIVGFPGESEEEFIETYNFLKKIKFYKMHIFKYSPKKGTKAEQMQNQISGQIKEKRSRILIELSNTNEREYNNSYIGKEFEVLFEEREGSFIKGHTTNYVMVKVQTKEELENQIRKVEITKTEKLDVIGILKDRKDNYAKNKIK